jgi:hypothetical protein
MKAYKSLRYELYQRRHIPWKPWFAWRPVTTVSGRWVWWEHIYRKYGNTYVDHDDFSWYYYADEFDILKDYQFHEQFNELINP